MASTLLVALSLGYLTAPTPLANAPRLALAARRASISLQDEDPPPQKPWYQASKDTFARVAEGYKEGYDSGKEYFATPLSSEATIPSYRQEPLRRNDKIAAIVLTVILVEAVAFGAAFISLWLLGASEAFAGATSARLFAAGRAAFAFRAATRLPRLLVECIALPKALQAINARGTDLRATFVKDRMSQSLAILAVMMFTLRAINRTVLAGTTAPAAGLLYAAAIQAVSPVAEALPFVRPVAEAAGAVSATAWAVLVHIGQRLVAIDAVARSSPLNVVLYGVADLEKILAAPARFVVTALTAWWYEVVVPLLKTLGWLTVQTLG